MQQWTQKNHNNETNKAIMTKNIKKAMTMSIKNHKQKTNKAITNRNN